MRITSTNGLKAMAKLCAAMAVMTAATANGQPNAPDDAATAQSSSVEWPRPESAPGPEAGAIGIRDWQVNRAGQVLWAPSPAQARLGPSVRLPKPRPRERSAAYRGAQRILGAVALGMVGFLAGGMIGAVAEGECHCDSPGLQGFVTGGYIGAAAAATLGIVLIP